MIKKILLILLSALVFVSCSAEIISPSSNSSISGGGNDQSGGGTVKPPTVSTEEQLIEKYGIDIGLEDAVISQKIEENLKAYYEEMGAYRLIFIGVPKDYTQSTSESLSILIVKSAMKINNAKNIDVDIRNIDFKNGSINEMMFSGETISDDIILNFILPNNQIKIVESMAFMNLGNIKQITIPNSITMVGEYGFAYCYQLERLEFESGIQTIWASSFLVAEKLKELVIPDTVKSIETEAFGNCGLTELIIPASITSIGDYAFVSSINLTTIIYLGKTPNDIASAGQNIFYGCDKLTTLIIPNASD
ncbi:leucine-rich repeat domain-containing protein [uncultured Brachyspira sp.]|uniref:leucine-rich repeat domain-containing protein n=1 Tax=uncultured Brachyspira sp. TaxID=221953 RepID=UPI002627A089|nr:leucine-rich repeat domain-containing protein [uncultured Brachyspira sp.]